VSEFSIIDRYCRDLGRLHPETQVRVGDDAAIVSVPDNMVMAVSIDTMVEGVHFFKGTSAADIAHKLLAVNLSDMAAMGAIPKWATIALTLPDTDENWLAEFSDQLSSQASDFGVELIGGDTTRGPLTLSLNIMGLLPKGKALTRNGAKLNDDVYVSNSLGDAAVALKVLNGQSMIDDRHREALLAALHRPVPQVELGQQLLNVASACIDISDGLLADLEHVARQSNLTITIEVDALPLSVAYQNFIANGGDVVSALTGGDDYQLAFTAPVKRRHVIMELAAKLNVPLSRIGQTVARQGHAIELTRNGIPFQLDGVKGYQHFV